MGWSAVRRDRIPPGAIAKAIEGANRLQRVPRWGWMAERRSGHRRGGVAKDLKARSVQTVRADAARDAVLWLGRGPCRWVSDQTSGICPLTRSQERARCDGMGADWRTRTHILACGTS